MVTLAAVVVLIVGIQAIIRMYNTFDGGAVGVIAALIGVVLYLAVAYGLWKGNKIAWILALIGGALALLSVFSGDWLSFVTGIVLLVLLLLPQSRAWFNRS
ncbi:hypothetical protein [Micromonospora cathayae]|uniref:Uncharacterized protein n=1 Tax=Micromonospora cathayae TaxID=3028804 RepID=A0ABY7ZVZ3_9ACTN|nr:hypothetical protein [Micromonospora sp. HUAS 3]WDZ87230.1 hypothetical protein PVK37_12880 [Micromonospora sp. HUAS 3]